MVGFIFFPKGIWKLEDKFSSVFCKNKYIHNA